MSQQEFAEVGGVKRASQHLYEHDVRSPDASYLTKLQGAGVDVLFLLSGLPSMPSVRGPVVPVSRAIGALRAVDEYGRKHGAAVTEGERERLFEAFCGTLTDELPLVRELPRKKALGTKRAP